jgi:hypothetical protein
MNIPLHIVLWAVYNGLSISSHLMSGREGLTGAAISAALGVLSVALVAGAASGIFLTLEVARWFFMIGLAGLASVVKVDGETSKLLSPLVVTASLRMTLAAVTWLYML